MRAKTVILCLSLPLVLAVAAGAADEKPAPVKAKPALLVIDTQNAFMPYMDPKDVKRATEVINYTIGLFRQNGFPVVRVYHTTPGEGPEPGTEPFQFPDTLAIREDDPKVVKNHTNAFKKTELDALLRERGVDTVFLTGLSAVACVLATYHGALDNDYKAFMVKDALISHDATLTHYVEEITSTVDGRALQLLLETARAE
jgi:nicotinamidase-related amidase